MVFASRMAAGLGNEAVQACDGRPHAGLMQRKTQDENRLQALLLLVTVLLFLKHAYTGLSPSGTARPADPARRQAGHWATHRPPETQG